MSSDTPQTTEANGKVSNRGYDPLARVLGVVALGAQIAALGFQLYWGSVGLANMERMYQVEALQNVR